MESSKQLCKVCLGSPTKWNSDHTSCEGLHSTRRRESAQLRRNSALCVHPDCPYHYMMCPNHVDQNKKHPNKKHPDSWLRTTKANYPNIVGLSSETIMLLPEPDVNKPLDCPLTQEGQLPAEKLVGALTQVSYHLPQPTSVGYQTFIIPEENVPRSIDSAQDLWVPRKPVGLPHYVSRKELKTRNKKPIWLAMSAVQNT